MKVYMPLLSFLRSANIVSIWYGPGSIRISGSLLRRHGR